MKGYDFHVSDVHGSMNAKGRDALLLHATHCVHTLIYVRKLKFMS